MGGCCCSSRKPQLHGTPVYYYCPPVFDDHESFTSHDSAATVFTSGFLVDLNLDMSTPDTYRPPPAPIPYDVVFGCPQSTDSESLGETISDSGFANFSTCVDLKEPDCKTDTSKFLDSPKKFEFELVKSSDLNVSATEEEDVCPTCLEEYDAENPKIITKCNHDFHLSCILEWMERSDTCPICNQVCLVLYSIIAMIGCEFLAFIVVILIIGSGYRYSHRKVIFKKLKYGQAGIQGKKKFIICFVYEYKFVAHRLERHQYI